MVTGRILYMPSVVDMCSKPGINVSIPGAYELRVLLKMAARRSVVATTIADLTVLFRYS